MPLRSRPSYANGSSGAMSEQRYVARNFCNIGIRSEFNIENMKLFRGWLTDDCALTMKFQSVECTRARCNYWRIKRGYVANKFTLEAENAGKEFTTSHSILLMSECY